MNMREKLAGAIGGAIDVADPLVGNVVEKRDLLAAADAVLDALREPTPEMIEAGAVFMYGERDFVSDMWQAMITQAKSDV
jgi:hypothetical protein